MNAQVQKSIYELHYVPGNFKILDIRIPIKKKARKLPIYTSSLPTGSVYIFCIPIDWEERGNRQNRPPISSSPSLSLCSQKTCMFPIQPLINVLPIYKYHIATNSNTYHHPFFATIASQSKFSTCLLVFSSSFNSYLYPLIHAMPAIFAHSPMTQPGSVQFDLLQLEF